MERTMTFDHATPDHNSNLRVICTEPRGAIQFLIYTSWHLPNVYDKLSLAIGHDLCRPTGVDVTIHVKERIEEGFGQHTDVCRLLDNGPCWATFHSLKAKKMLDTLIREGSDVLFEELESFYYEVTGYGEKCSDTEEHRGMVGVGLPVRLEG